MEKLSSAGSGIKSKGYISFEVLGAITLSLVIVAGLATIFSQSLETQKANEARALLWDLSLRIERAFATRARYLDLDLLTAKDLGILPSRYENGIGPGNSTITLDPWDVDDRHYQIGLSFDNSDEAYRWCVELLENSDSYWVATGTDKNSLEPDHSLETLLSECEGSSSLYMVR